MGEWISLNDRWPEEWTMVLAYRPGTRHPFHLARWFVHNSGEKYWEMNGTSGHGVNPPTHWMPLPEAPSNGEEVR